MVLQDLLDPRQLLLFQRVRRFLPRLGALERNTLFRKNLTQPLPPDLELAVLLGRQILLEFADAPTGERLTQRTRAFLGHLDDEGAVVVTDPAGPATRPPRVQRGHSHLVEPVNHLTNTIRGRLHQIGDHLDRVPAR